MRLVQYLLQTQMFLLKAVWLWNIILHTILINHHNERIVALSSLFLNLIGIKVRSASNCVKFFVLSQYVTYILSYYNIFY